MAAPIRDKDGATIAVVGISAPRVRFPKERFTPVAKLVCAAANETGALLNSENEG